MSIFHNWQAKLLWFIGLTPLVLAWYMASTGWGLPEKTKNHGELIQLGVRVPQDLSELQQGRWGLLLVSDLCEKDCHAQLLLMQQVHKSLGKEFYRMQSIFVEKQSYELFPPGNAQTSHPTLENITYWFKQEKLPISDHSIWLIDPEGNLVLRYPIGSEGKQMLEDIRWLLKVSRIG